MAGRPWTPCEIAYLQEHASTSGSEEIAQAMGRSGIAVKKMAARLGVQIVRTNMDYWRGKKHSEATRRVMSARRTAYWAAR